MQQLTRLSEILQQNSFDDVVLDVERHIRSEPNSLSHRMALFQLLLVNGRWERALKQLQTCYVLSNDLSKIVQTYGDLIRAEYQREKVFSAKVHPHFFNEKPVWIDKVLEAIDWQQKEAFDLADQARLQAFEGLTESACTVHLTNESFELAWLVDMDSRIGAVMELMYCGRYFWLPIEQVQYVKFSPIVDVRDLIWRPVEILIKGDQEPMYAFMPGRYPNSYLTDGDEKLCKKTSWVNMGDTGVYGLGQRMWMGDDHDFSINDCTQLIFK